MHLPMNHTLDIWTGPFDLPSPKSPLKEPSPQNGTPGIHDLSELNSIQTYWTGNLICLTLSAKGDGFH